MSSPAAGVGSSLARLVRPQSRFMPYKAEQDEERSRLLSKIDAFNREARRRLAVDLKRTGVLYVCVGLLDPVSNIIANTLLSRGNPHLVETAEEMGTLSLDGLVAFLLYFFPYLAGWEAVRYLLVADADLLVAARLIVADRGMMRLSVTSPASVQAFEGALLLAAEVAKHPDPECLVNIWMSLSSELQKCLHMLNNQPEEIFRSRVSIKTLLCSPPDLGNAWELAVSRLPYRSSIVDMPYQATRSLRMALLDTIRGFYLQALARLPRHELRTRYHRSLLRGGYCYGPFDPVSNIIVNTIWYDVMFPAAEQPVLDMIGPNSLTRLESRSFYGLASFLQTRYHNLSEHEVVQCLVASCAYLNFADRNLDNAASAGDDHLSVADLNLNNAAAIGGEAEWQRENCRSRSPGIYAAVRKMEEQSPCTSTQEAYEAAATAAWHSNPEAQAVFLSSCKSLLHGPALSLLQIGDQLTSENVQYIASLFCQKQKPIPERIKKRYHAVIDGKLRSEAQQRRVSRKVEAALGKYLLQDGEPMFELHIICSANDSVCGPEYCSDSDDALSHAPCKFRYSHVNFWATRKGSPYSDRHPILFFAEFDNEEEEGEPLLCCPVDLPKPFAEHVRCVYCEAEGLKIVHPASEKLHGGGREFDAVICGRRFLNNDMLICQNEYAVQRMCAVEEDFMYVVDFKY